MLEISYFSDIIGKDLGIWSKRRGKSDELVKKLIDLMGGSKAECTRKVYLEGFRKWKSFAAEHSFKVLPASEFDISLMIAIFCDSKFGNSILI